MRLSDLGILTGIVQADGRTYFNERTIHSQDIQTAVMLKKTLDYVELNFAKHGTVQQSGTVDGTIMSRLEALELALTGLRKASIDTMDLQLRITALENRISSLGISTNGSRISEALLNPWAADHEEFVEDLSLTTKKLDTLAVDVRKRSELHVKSCRHGIESQRCCEGIDTLSGNISTIRVRFLQTKDLYPL